MSREYSSRTNNIKWMEFFQIIGSRLINFTMTGCYHEPLTPNILLPLLVQTCPKLVSLELRWNNITETTLYRLADYNAFVHLHTFDLTGCQILDDTLLIDIFVRTGKDFHLRKLILHACTNVTWTSLDAIAICLPNLQHLNVSRCIGLKNISIDENTTCFSHWPQLEYIDFSHLLTLTDNDLIVVLNHCQYLKTLIFDHCIHLTDQTISRLSINTEMLSIDHCTNITTNALMNLNEQCPCLNKISLRSIKNLTDHCILKWSDSPFNALKSLTIDYCTECTINSIERFLETHPYLYDLSIIGNIISTMIEQRRLEQRFSGIKFVFR
jgi:hypothetical protein